MSETTAQLQEVLANKEKMTQNFADTEKLYVDKIKNLTEELESTQADLGCQTERFVILNFFDIDNNNKRARQCCLILSFRFRPYHQISHFVSQHAA